MMSQLSAALSWYQKKIGAYDKQSWEKTVDQCILRGVCAVPKKMARIKTELIDVDLVRGSAFPKAKPQHSWIAATISGVIRVLFMPAYFTWWKLQTNTLVSCVLVILYVLQILVIYLFHNADDNDFADVPVSEAFLPVAMMLILGVLHSQIVATFSSKSSRKHVTRTKRRRVKRKVRMKQPLDYDTKSSPETASDDRVESAVVDNSCHSINCGCIAQLHEKQLSEQQNYLRKKRSDDESGLDIADVPQQLIDKSAFDSYKCKTHHDSGCVLESSSDLRCRCECARKCLLDRPLPHQNSNSPQSKHINLYSSCQDTNNASSGEEYFVPKKPLLTAEQWNKYLLQVKRSTANFGKHFCLTKNNQKSYPSRRYSDIGPFQATQYCRSKLHARSRNIRNSEENNLLSFTDPCDVNSVGDMLKKNCVSHTEGCNGIRQGIRARRGVPTSLRIPIKCERSCSSCDSAQDTTSVTTPLKPQTSDMEWPLITNTDCNSDTSDCCTQSTQDEENYMSPTENPFAWEIQQSAASSFNGCPGSDKVSCAIWERNECKKVDLSVLDISSAIIRKVDSSVHSTEYLAVGVLFSMVICLLPLLFRLQSGTTMDSIQDVTLDVINFTVPSTHDVAQIVTDLLEITLGSNWRVQTVVSIVMLQRFTLSVMYFFLLSVAEKTFKQRFLYAKHFCYLTSSRRARRSDLPHFRLNKVRNIKTWLSVRSYLKKLGPQRSVDVIVSITFILEVCVISFLCVQLLRETGQFSGKLYCWETLFWTLALGFYLLRFMIIGSKINKKYRNLSVLITEQINLYLHMEQKPHKKDELMLANSVLKLAADLLKELESPFKISGLCANPYLYNITKVVVLSAFSAVLTEVLGFKLKLYKIKIK